jgi:hypothetical protein
MSSPKSTSPLSKQVRPVITPTPKDDLFTPPPKTLKLKGDDSLTTPKVSDSCPDHDPNRRRRRDRDYHMHQLMAKHNYDPIKLRDLSCPWINSYLTRMGK